MLGRRHAGPRKRSHRQILNLSLSSISAIIVWGDLMHNPSEARESNRVLLSWSRHEGINLPTESRKPNKPTKNELELLNYLGLSESDGILVTIGDPPCHRISTDNESEPILIPFSNLTCQKDPSLQIDT